MRPLGGSRLLYNLVDYLFIFFQSMNPLLGWVKQGSATAQARLLQWSLLVAAFPHTLTFFLPRVVQEELV